MDRQQIFAIMETDPLKSLAAFNAAAADLLNATYIIVSGKISKLLQSIAASRPLYDYLSSETRGYNFIDEFRGRQLRDENGRAFIAVPTDPSEQVRFAFCMLYAIDTGKLNFEKMLHTFYYNNDANTELRAFCNDVVRPFADNVNAIFTRKNSVDSEPASQPQNSGPQRSEHAPSYATDSRAPVLRESNAPVLRENTAPMTAPGDLPVASEQSQQTFADALVSATCAALGDVTCEIIGIISHDNALTVNEREELLLVCDAFAAAAEIKERKAIRLTYVALKNTLRASSIFGKLAGQYAALNEYVSKLDIDVNG